MKKITLFVLAAVMTGFSSFAQSGKNTEWPEMTAFKAIKDANFTPAEKGNLAPLKANVANIYRVAKKWMGSAIPSGYNTEKTQTAIKDLNIKCHDIWSKVEAKASDKEIKKLVKEANGLYNKIATECTIK